MGGGGARSHAAPAPQPFLNKASGEPRQREILSGGKKTEKRVCSLASKGNVSKWIGTIQVCSGKYVLVQRLQVVLTS